MTREIKETHKCDFVKYLFIQTIFMIKKIVIMFPQWVEHNYK